MFALPRRPLVTTPLLLIALGCHGQSASSAAGDPTSTSSAAHGATSSAADGSSAAAPGGAKVGTVPPGGKCRRNTPEVADYEGKDDCAPVAAFAGRGSRKGSVCVAESGPGAYCRHDCSTNEDCSDLVREGFFSECFGGGCVLTKKK